MASAKRLWSLARNLPSGTTVPSFAKSTTQGLVTKIICKITLLLGAHCSLFMVFCREGFFCKAEGALHWPLPHILGCSFQNHSQTRTQLGVIFCEIANKIELMTIPAQNPAHTAAFTVHLYTMRGVPQTPLTTAG